MDYITYKRYKGSGIGGYFNLRHGTKVTENGGFLHAPDGRGICAVTSEDGWEHFRPDTPEGAYRQKLLDKLYRKTITGIWQSISRATRRRILPPNASRTLIIITGKTSCAQCPRRS